MELLKDNPTFKYLSQREVYLVNAYKMKRRGRFRKASELMWGAVTQTIKALASINDIKIRSHDEFEDYIRDISGELRDEQYITKYILMESLHRNFYDEFIKENNIDVHFIEAQEFLKLLDKLIQEQLGTDNLLIEIEKA